MYRSGAIAVSVDARELCGAVLSPPLAALVAPLSGVNRTLTIGLLPPHLREAYGLTWTSRDDRRLGRTVKAVRAVRRVLPRAVALWPEARRR
jgi:uncharacterized protein (DUF2236 family)